MSVSGFIAGILIFILCLFLAQAVPTFLTTLTSQALDLLKIFFLFAGVSAIFIGALSK